MSWNRKRKISGKNKNYSISKKLRKEFKSSEEFEVMLNNLSLEDIIALKLEISARVMGGYLYGMPIWKSIKYITEDAILKFALSATRTRAEAMRLLGLRRINYRGLQFKYKTESFFEEEDDNVQN